jgi:ABC-type nitrate/sulfonate/bicarbonate transport system substrate-binding protein
MNRRDVIAGLAAAAALPAVAQPARASDTIRMAGVPFDVTALPYYGVSSGIFKKYNIEIEFNTFSVNGAAIAAAVTGGSMDVGVSNIPSLALAHLKKFPFTLIFGGGLYTSASPVDALLVPNGSTLRDAKDFDGKTVGVNGLNNISQYGVQAWIDKSGAGGAQIKYIEVQPGEMPAALASGHIDAANTTEPYVSLDKGAAHVVAHPFDAISSRFLICAFFTTTDWADAHPDLLKRLQIAMRETARWTNANHDATADIIANLSKIDIKTVHAMNRTTYPEVLDASILQPIVDATSRYGNVDHFRAEEMIYKPR